MAPSLSVSYARLALAVVVVCCLSLSTHAAPAPWQDLLSADCSGNVRLFPSHPIMGMGVNATILTKIYNFATAAVTSRVNCACEGATSASTLLDLGNVLAAMESKTDGASGQTLRASCGLKGTVDQIGQWIGGQMPSTCSSAGYSSGKACAFQFPMPTFNLALQMSIQRCPGAAAGTFPSINLACSGAACTDLMLPCQVDSDCVKSSCTKFSATTADQINTAMLSALDAIGVLPLGQTSCKTANIGLDTFQQLTQIFGNLMMSKTGKFTSSSITSTGFCGVAPFIPVLITSTRYADWQQTAMDYISTGIHFFKPMVDSLVKNAFGITDGLFVNSVTAWDGVLDDGTSVTAAPRLSGINFAPLASNLPTPSMATAGTPVQLLSSSCNLTANMLPGQPIAFALSAPAIQTLYNGVFGVVGRLQKCYWAGNALTAEQLNANFNPVAPEFWLRQYTPGNSGPINFSPAGKMFTASSGTVVNTVSTCSYASYVSTGQCSLKYSYLGNLINKDMTLSLDLQRCLDCPSALPSVSLQCTGADCNSYLSTAAVKTCVQDSDCGSTGNRCQMIDVNSADSWVLKQLINKELTPNQATCDSGLKLARDVFNFAKSLSGQPQTDFTAQPFTDATTFGVCTFNLQDSIAAVTSTSSKAWADGLTTVSTVGAVRTSTVNGLTSLTTAIVDNCLVPGTCGGSPVLPVVPGDMDMVVGTTAVVSFSLNVPFSAADTPTYKQNFLNDLSTALNIALSRISVTFTEITVSVSPSALLRLRVLAASTTSATVSIAPSTDSVVVTPNAAIVSLKAQLADSNSVLLTTGTGKVIQANSVVVQKDGQPNAASAARASFFTITIAVVMAVILTVRM